VKLQVLASKRAGHQMKTAAALIAGLRMHGDDGEIIHAIEHANGPYVACWGWRAGRRLRGAGKHVLVMERGYVGDRFLWTSLGWNGLNGRATFPDNADPSRWQANFNLLPWKKQSGEKRLVIMGQVPRDASLQHVNYLGWVNGIIGQAKQQGWRVYVRPHPLAPVLPVNAKLLSGSLIKALSFADLVVTFNSNSAVDAVVAGTPAVSCDPGSMAWAVTSHDLSVVTPDRIAWASRLAWCQWLPDEIANGCAWDHLKGLVA
jgi:hypothetical protein